MVLLPKIALQLYFSQTMNRLLFDNHFTFYVNSTNLSAPKPFDKEGASDAMLPKNLVS